MVPEEDDMIEICRVIESAGHDVGWDGPQALVLVTRRPNAYMVSPFGTQPVLLSPSPGEGLEMLVEGFEAGVEAAQNIDPVLADTLAGIAYVFHTRDRASGKQARFVMLCDCGGRFYQIIRYRGSGIEEAVTGPGGTPRFRGVIPSLLIRLVKVLLEAAPGDSGNREALDELLRKAGSGG